MGILATLFGNTKTVETAVKLADDSVRGVGKWIDEQQFTEQEKSEAYAKAAAMHIKVLETIQNESGVRSVTRRIMAWAVVGTFLSILLLGAIMYKFDPAYGDFLLTVATKSMLGELTLGISVFYFGAHLMRAFKK